MENSKIGWTHHTWNPWQGCNKVSAACRLCYIAKDMRRRDRSIEPFNGPMRSLTTWPQPQKWNREAEELDYRPRVFTCSLSDFFHRGADGWRDEAWDVIRACANLDWLILTKRPQRIADHLPDDWGSGYPNVWLGTTVESARVIRRIEHLVETPAAAHFVSAEPLLGPIDFRPHLSRLDWIITGCEQAHQDKRKPMNLDWVRDIRDQCCDAGVAHFLKQYYVGNQLQFDGLLDGEVCQEWPSVSTV